MRILSGSVWCEELGEEYADAKTKLFNVPGLRFAEHSKRVEGSIDALAATALRLNRTLPSLPQAGVFSDESLFPYQRHGVAWLLGCLRRHGGALIADEMGLGKSRQSIECAKELTRGGGRVLVIAPAFLRANWVAELKKWGVTDVAALAPKTNKKSKQDWEDASKARWVISSYDFAPKALAAAFRNESPRMLIMDEAHYLKGRDNARAKTLESLAAVCTYRLAITGTPQYNRPRDLYQLLKLLFGRRFGTSFEFDLAYCGGQLNQWGGVDNRGATNTDELKLRLSYYMLRRLKSEVLNDLPELSRNVVWVPADTNATLAFHMALDSKNAGATYQALRATLEAKMEPVMNAAQDAKQFLLFTWLKEHAYEMGRRLAEELDTPCEIITGDIAADKRVALVARAASSGHGVVATLDSMGAGINAQSLGTTGLFHALDYTPAKMLQAEARLHRIGQTRGVTWTYFAMQESMDELVVRTVVDKLDQHMAVMGDGKDSRDAFGDADAADADCLKALYEEMS